MLLLVGAQLQRNQDTLITNSNCQKKHLELLDLIGQAYHASGENYRPQIPYNVAFMKMIKINLVIFLQIVFIEKGIKANPLPAGSWARRNMTKDSHYDISDAFHDFMMIIVLQVIMII